MRTRRLFFDERKMSADVADVLEAAALLEVAEFEFFRLAHVRWYGTTVEEPELERLYLPYMFHGRVPLWARQLAREVIAEADADRLDPKSFGVLPKPLSMAMYNRGLRYLLWLTLIFGALLTGAATIAELAPWHQSCYLPPCY